MPSQFRIIARMNGAAPIDGFEFEKIELRHYSGAGPGGIERTAVRVVDADPSKPDSYIITLNYADGTNYGNLALSDLHLQCQVAAGYLPPEIPG